jgi:hypothetical protein
MTCRHRHITWKLDRSGAILIWICTCADCGLRWRTVQAPGGEEPY